MALDFLCLRRMTESKMRRKLTSKGYPEQEVEETVNKLIDWKYLDDRDYAQAYIKTKCTKLSRNRIISALQKDGIERELISGLLDQYYPAKQEYLNCLEAGTRIWEEELTKWEKRYGYNPECQDGYPESERAGRFARMIGEKLYLRGFPVKIIQEVLNKIAERAGA